MAFLIAASLGAEAAATGAGATGAIVCAGTGRRACEFGPISTLGSAGPAFCGSNGGSAGAVWEVAAKSACVPIFVLHAQNAFADLARPIFDDRRLPLGVSLAQFFEQTSGGAELHERGLELIVVLEFVALLRRHIGLKKDLARIIGLGRKRNGRREKRKTGEQDQTDFLHAWEKRKIAERR